MTAQTSERALRCAVVTLACVAAFAPVLLLAPRHAWWQDPSFTLLVLLVGGFGCLRGELDPSMADGWSAERARRYAPGAIGLILVVSLLFPTFGTWYVLWLLFFVTAALLPFAYVSSIRCVVLCLCSTGALAGVVVTERAAWSLLPVALAWALIPGLDRLARMRLRTAVVDVRRADVLPFLVGGGGALTLGVLVYGLASAILPPSTRDYEVLDLLAPRPGGVDTPTPELPGLDVYALLALVVIGLLLAGRFSSGTSGKKALEAGEMRVGAQRAVAPVDRTGELSRWPKGPRRRLVERYLEHLGRLERLGHGCPPGSTPSETAEALSSRLPPALADAARRLAERFGRARWHEAPVADEDEQAAAREALAVEEVLLPMDRAP